MQHNETQRYIIMIVSKVCERLMAWFNSGGLCSANMTALVTAGANPVAVSS